MYVLDHVSQRVRSAFAREMPCEVRQKAAGRTRDGVEEGHRVRHKQERDAEAGTGLGQGAREIPDFAVQHDKVG